MMYATSMGTSNQPVSTLPEWLQTRLNPPVYFRDRRPLADLIKKAQGISTEINDHRQSKSKPSHVPVSINKPKVQQTLAGQRLLIQPKAAPKTRRGKGGSSKKKGTVYKLRPYALTLTTMW